MKYRSVENWANPATYSGLLFFAQRMEELTFAYSLDSYKAPATNAPFLVGECIDQLNDCLKKGLPTNSAFHVLDELEDRLRGNIVAKSIASLRVENYVGTDRNNIDELRRRLSVLRREIDPQVYALRIMEMIAPLAKTKRKHDLNFLARELATTLIGLRVNPFHINSVVRSTFFSEKIVHDEGVLDDFFRDVFPHGHTFTVCLKIGTTIDNIDEKLLKDTFGITISDTTDDIFTIKQMPNGFGETSDSQKYISVENVIATDTHSAIQYAHEKIAHVHDLFRLFHHKARLEIDDNGIAEQKCCAGEIKLVPARVNRMLFINDRKPTEAAKELPKFMKGLNLQKGPERHKFFRVIDFHGMSLSTEIVENQILNLWISFETIVPEDARKSVVRNVADRILPFTGLLYIRRLFRCLTLDIIRWDRRSLIVPLRDAEFDTNSDLIDKIFCLVLLDNFAERLDDFLGRMRNFELLKYRVFRLKKSFSTPEKTRKTLEQHQKRVEWQIHRIYRTRNAIVHSGKTPRYAALLVDNAHDYLDQTFELSCGLSSGPGGFRSFSECFDFVGFQYSQYLSDMSAMPAYDLDSAQKTLWRPRAVPTRRRLFPQAQED